MSKATVIVGGQWGDEGKGKIIAYLCNKEKPSVIARGGVGPNAGHTVIIGNKKFGLRMIPSGFAYKKAKLLIGSGVVVDPNVLLKEIELTKTEKRLGVDFRCGIIEEKHRIEDSQGLLKEKIGTTGTGCGTANRDRALRILKQAKDIEELKPYLTDVAKEVNSALNDGKNIFVEGSQGFGLSLFFGSYPFVTSKDTSSSQICADVGIGPTRIKDVIVVFKAFPTRVGGGPFPTEMSMEQSERLGIVEYGTVTGRRRRIGYFDYEMARYSCMVNSATQIALTKVDALDKNCKGVKEYKKLPKKVKDFVYKIEKETKVPVKIISTGAEISETIYRK